MRNAQTAVSPRKRTARQEPSEALTAWQYDMVSCRPKPFLGSVTHRGTARESEQGICSKSHSCLFTCCSSAGTFSAFKASTTSALACLARSNLSCRSLLFSCNTMPFVCGQHTRRVHAVSIVEPAGPNMRPPSHAVNAALCTDKTCTLNAHEILHNQQMLQLLQCCSSLQL